MIEAPETDPPALTAEQVAARLELRHGLPMTRTRLYELRAAGEGPPAVKVGRYTRWPREAVDAWAARLLEGARP